MQFEGMAFAGSLHGQCKGFGVGLAIGSDAGHIDNVAEIFFDLKDVQDASGVVHVRIGEDQVAGGEGGKH